MDESETFKRNRWLNGPLLEQVIGCDTDIFHGPDKEPRGNAAAQSRGRYSVTNRETFRLRNTVKQEAGAIRPANDPLGMTRFILSIEYAVRMGQKHDPGAGRRDFVNGTNQDTITNDNRHMRLNTIKTPSIHRNPPTGIGVGAPDDLGRKRIHRFFLGHAQLIPKLNILLFRRVESSHLTLEMNILIQKVFIIRSNSPDRAKDRKGCFDLKTKKRKNSFHWLNQYIDSKMNRSYN